MRSNRTPGWLLIGIAVLASGCASAYRSGQVALEEGRNLEAASLFGKALEEDPTRVDALLARLAPHMHLGPAWSSLGLYPYGVPRP